LSSFRSLYSRRTHFHNGPVFGEQVKSANGPQGGLPVNPEAPSHMPIQFQAPCRSPDLHADTGVEAKILDLLDRHGPRANTGGLAVGTAYDIP